MATPRNVVRYASDEQDGAFIDDDVDPGLPAQRVGDDGGLQPALGPGLHVLPVAAPAPGGHERARRRDPVG